MLKKQQKHPELITNQPGDVQFTTRLAPLQRRQRRVRLQPGLTSIRGAQAILVQSMDFLGNEPWDILRSYIN
jgi:hypothetical protein